MNEIHKLNYLSLLYFVIRSSFLSILTPIFLNLNYEGSYSFLMAIIIGILFFFIYVYLSHRFNDKNLFDIHEFIYGKKLATILNLIFVISILLYMSILFLNLSNFIYTEYLNESNFYIILFFFFLFVLYFTKKNLNSLCKSSFIFLIFSIFLFIIKTIGLIDEINFTYGLHFNIHSFNLKEITEYIIFSITPIFCLLMIPLKKVKNYNSFKKYQYLTYILTGINLFINFSLILLILGPNLANNYLYPEFHLMKSVKIFGFIEKIESILSMGFIFDMIISLVLFAFTIKEFTKKYLQKNYYLPIIIILFLFCALYSLDSIKILFKIVFIFFTIDMITFFTTLVISKLRNP